MAERRMFNKSLMLSNRFALLSKNAQRLYLFVNLHADDDGICGNSRGVCRMCGCSSKNLQELIDGGWLLSFDSGEVAVAHWLVHNQIRKDRYKPSIYRQAAQRLQKGEDGAYVLSEPGCHLVADPATQGRQDQKNIGKDNIDQESEAQDRPGKKIPDELTGPSSGPADAACDDIEIEYDKYLNYYQCMCKDLVPCEALTPKLRDKIALCFKAGYTPMHMLTTFMAANQSAFLKGENKRHWRADLMWLLDPLHIRDVDAGKYDTWL